MTTPTSPGRLVVVGASGHGKVVADSARLAGWEVLGFLDRDGAKAEWAGLPVLGTEDDLSRVLGEFPDLRIVVAIGDNAARKRVAERVAARIPAGAFATVVHPAAVLAPDVELGPGTVVMAGAVLNPGVRVGAHCIVNTGAVVDHDCVLEDLCTVSPGARLGGNVTVGEDAVVGIGATVIHGVHLGAGSVLGAGAVAVGDVPERVVAYGVPARVIRTRANGEPYL